MNLGACRTKNPLTYPAPTEEKAEEEGKAEDSQSPLFIHTFLLDVYTESNQRIQHFSLCVSVVRVDQIHGDFKHPRDPNPCFVFQ
jgi:hypothetical protein